MSRIQDRMNSGPIFEKLDAMGQMHLLSHWKNLSDVQKIHLEKQIASLEFALFQRQREEIFSPVVKKRVIEPFTSYHPSGKAQDREFGEELIRERKCGCLVLAGGQGSRLRYEGPKGCYPISFTGKTLFQLLAEKIRAASKKYGQSLSAAIMTSPLNHVETVAYFKKNNFFGLDPSQLTFFTQKMWPFLDFEGNYFLEGPDRLAQGPNGNGGIFRQFVEDGVWEKWRAMGIETINLITIDNPLASPFDQELFGFHKKNHCDVTIKAARRRDPEEKVGILARVGGHPSIVEYSEISEEEKHWFNGGEQGELFQLANLGLFCFSLSFIKEVSGMSLPLHKAMKSVKALGSDGKAFSSEIPNAWKFEEFIFDTFVAAKRCEALVYPRETCFAPLKNLQGEDSIGAVQEALLDLDRKIFLQVTQITPPAGKKFELASQFYFPTGELIEYWRDKPFPQQDYIEE